MVLPGLTSHRDTREVANPVGADVASRNIGVAMPNEVRRQPGFRREEDDREGGVSASKSSHSGSSFETKTDHNSQGPVHTM